MRYFDVVHMSIAGNSPTQMGRKDVLRRLRKRFTYRRLNVELTNACMLRCPLCSTGSGFDKRPKGMMDFGDYRQFLDTCAALFDTIDFFGSGEPLMHPRFAEFVRYAARERRKFTTCSTNGMSMEDPDSIVESGLHEIQVAVDGLTQAQFQQYRVGGNLEAVLNNIKKLVDRKRRSRSVYPQVFISTLISRHNENEYNGFIKLAREIGVDGITLGSIFDDLLHTTDWFPRSARFRHIKRPGGGGGFNCMFQDAFGGMLSWDGDLLFCCLSPNHRDPMVKVNVFREGDFLERIDWEHFYHLTRNAGTYAFCKDCVPANYITYSERIYFRRPLRYLLLKFKAYPLRLLMRPERLRRGLFRPSH
jgi:pyruvate-formate lyase-activating enzyme